MKTYINGKTKPLTYKESDVPIEKRVDDLLDRMTLPEKFGQMTQIEKNSISADAIGEFGIGSVLSGGGGNPDPNTPENWRAMVEAFQVAAAESRLGIPLLYGSDAVHGHNNVYSATIFPHNIGLGATNDPALVEEIGRVTALETAATSVRWNFAPAVSVARDIRWGRSYESYSQDPHLAAKLGAAYLKGSQGERLDLPTSVLGSVKHFVGDGGTAWGTTGRYEWVKDWWQTDGERWMIDQGDCLDDEDALRRVHLVPYLAAIEAGARNIMVSYNSWDGLRMHGQKYMLTDVLKGELGFTGFLVTDWLGINQLAADYYDGLVIGINAGIDMVMVPFDHLLFIKTMSEAVINGDIPITRVDDAVRRILTVKFELGLFDNDFTDRPDLALVGCEDHREIARQAVQKSAVLLKNENALPIQADNKTILVAGVGANDIGMQCGGWTIEWQGNPGPITVGETLLTGLTDKLPASTTFAYAADGNFPQGTKADIGIVVVSEMPYSEGEGDRSDVSLSVEEAALVARMREHCDTLIVVLYSGRPRIITPQLDQIDGLVAAWLPGSEAAALADVLLGNVPFSGTLSFAWPRTMDQVPYSADHDFMWPIGFGLTA